MYEERQAFMSGVDEIREIEKGLYFVHGKVIREVFPGQYDGDSGQAELVWLSGVIGKDEHDVVCYGDLTVFTFHPLHDDPDGARYSCGAQLHFSELSDYAKSVLRKEFPDHADEF